MLTYSHYERGEVVRTSPIFEDDLDGRCECSKHGIFFRAITDEAMRRIGAESDEYLRTTSTRTISSLNGQARVRRRRNVDRSSCCGDFYNDMIEDQHD